jgi:hypothetical protein
MYFVITQAHVPTMSSYAHICYSVKNYVCRCYVVRSYVHTCYIVSTCANICTLVIHKHMLLCQ